ncbi:lysosome-associated membrane glycoprotein 2 isoform X2 [Nerophis ophidion]|uniref:lysosome-associated membrane glycoprotein 2 isoform X2 n=1 Tax=Nerophis ophidion TaxID=159077 RepID=UPI002ADFD852|nr:lysosome-associated membrane glycoprotein 2 isoform X2 [Nerophis ophidion]
MPGGDTGGWFVLFLAAIIPVMHLQGSDESLFAVPNLEDGPARPVLQSSQVLPQIGTYTLAKPGGGLCIKATLGVQYMVTLKKRWYYNLDPSEVLSSGYCHKEAAVLSLTRRNDAAGLQFHFKKVKRQTFPVVRVSALISERNTFYVTKLTASVSPRPLCPGCANKTYSGWVEHASLFAASFGGSFRCRSANVLHTSSEMSLLLVSLQVQAFGVPAGRYGEGVECLADFNRRVLPVVFGAVVMGLLLMAVLTFLLVRDRRGYERL